MLKATTDGAPREGGPQDADAFRPVPAAGPGCTAGAAADRHATGCADGRLPARGRVHRPVRAFRWADLLSGITAVDDVVPKADIEERDDSYVIDVELPGSKREDVDTQITQGHLVVTGERTERERVGLLRHRNRTTGRFRLAVPLPSAIDDSAVTATMEHGLLTVMVPKVESARRRVLR